MICLKKPQTPETVRPGLFPNPCSVDPKISAKIHAAGLRAAGGDAGSVGRL